MYIRFFVIAILLTSVVSCNSTSEANSEASNNALPDAPVGYAWYRAKNGTGSFLKPSDWHIKENVEGATSALFISKENIDVLGRYATGLSINKIERFSTEQHLLPSLYAKKLALGMQHTGDVLKQTVVKGNFPDMNIIRINLVEKNTIVHYIAICDDTNDAVYIINFEAPEKNWDEEFVIAKPMLNYFVL